MKKKLLIGIGVCILLIVAGGLFLYAQLNAKLDKINYSSVSQENIKLNEGIVNDSNLTPYTNIALFGVDSRDSNSKRANSDTIIVMSIDHNRQMVNIVSVYRDTLLNVGNEEYLKCNSAYLLGGSEQAVSMLNENLDLNIKEYITVDFSALAEIVDAIDGVTIALTDEEVTLINKFCEETAQITGKSYVPISPEVGGIYKLNGIQAVCYARIRYTDGNDFKRTERQRKLIELINEKAKKSSPKVLLKIMDNVFPLIETNFSKDDLLSLGFSILSYSIEESLGFPFDFRGEEIDTVGSCVIPDTLASNVKKLHKLLFRSDDFKVSEEVEENSYNIELITGNGY